MATSNYSLSFILLLSTTTLLFSSAITTVQANIEEVCDAVEAASQNNGNAPPVNSAFCVASLRADPKSATADKPGLAAIAIRLSNAKATGSKAKIERLKKGNVSSLVRDILDMCSNLYANGISRLESARKVMGAGKYKEAVGLLDSVRDVGYNCDTVFFEGGQRNVVAKEGGELALLVVIAQEILASLG